METIEEVISASMAVASSSLSSQLVCILRMNDRQLLEGVLWQ